MADNAPVIPASTTPAAHASEEADALHDASRSALLIAGFYFGLATVYITVSGRLASTLSGSVESLARIEEIKGVLFVALTAVALLFWSRFVLRRAAREMARRDRALRLLDRQALAGTMASAIAHDSNNALTVAQSNTQVLLRSSGLRPEDREIVEDVSLAVDRLVQLMKRLRDIGSPKRLKTVAEFDLSEEVRAVVEQLRKHPNVGTATLQLLAPAPVPLQGYRLLIGESLTNLVLNATDAAGPRAMIHVEVTRVDGCPVLRVDDNGPGVADALRPQLFKPFFTTKRDGTGLGLSSVASCAADHGGRVEVGRSPLGGARFEVWLPGAPAATVAAA